jgi:hypothetical protein
VGVAAETVEAVGSDAASSLVPRVKAAVSCAEEAVCVAPLEAPARSVAVVDTVLETGAPSDSAALAVAFVAAVAE